MARDKAIPVEMAAVDATTNPNTQTDHACLHVKSSPHKANARTFTIGTPDNTMLEAAKRNITGARLCSDLSAKMVSRKCISSDAKHTTQPSDIPRDEKVPMAFICMFWTSTEAVVAIPIVAHKTTQPLISITTSPSPLTMWTRCKFSSIWATTSLWSSGRTMPSGPVFVQAWEMVPPSRFANGDILQDACGCQ